MLEVRDLDVEDLVQLLDDPEVDHNLLRILAEGLVDLERGRSIRVRHLEVVLCSTSVSFPSRCRGRADRGR